MKHTLTRTCAREMWYNNAIFYLAQTQQTLMINLLNRYGVSPYWCIVIFVMTLLLNLLTVAFGPYPGLSSEYFTALCYPEYGTALLNSPVDVVLHGGLLNLVSPASSGVAFGILQATIGALIMTCLFRIGIVAVRHATIDLTGIRQNELPHTLFAVSSVAFATGIGIVLLAFTTLPIWTIATRLYPESFTALLAVLTLTFALEFRWRTVLNLFLNRTPSIFDSLVLGLTFAGITFISLCTPVLIPVGFFALILAGKVFICHEAKARVPLLGAVALGILIGLVASVTVTALWANYLNVTQAPLPNMITLWAQTLSHKTALLKGYFSSLNGLCPLILFLLTAALHIGCFPHAYLKFGAPLIGQAFILALATAQLLCWPSEIWASFDEPNALCVIASTMTALCIGLLFGSWLHTFLCSKAHWSQPKIRITAVVAVIIFSGTFMALQANRNVVAAASHPMQAAMNEVVPLLDSLVPEETRLWLNDSPDTFGIFARHYIAEKPIQPHHDIFTIRTENILKQHGYLGSLAQKDPLVGALATLGSEPLRIYLTAFAAENGILIHFDAKTATQKLTQALQHLEASSFGTTPTGKRCVTLLKQHIARYHAMHAIHSDPGIAAAHLRLAHTLDPNNPGVVLSLAALETQGIVLTQEERHNARNILEANPSLRMPTSTAALAFENKYGPVATQGFCSASRLRRYQYGNAAATLNEILALYRTTPEMLSETERAIALLHLPEDEAGECVAKTTPESGDMELYFCLYPHSELTETLYRKYQRHLTDRNALTVLFRNKKSHLHERTADKMLAFFLRDGHLAHALYHLNALLDAGKYEEAITFVGGFNVRERLGKTPALIEELCLRVLEKIAPIQPDRARETCATWLRYNPHQYRLWSFLLNNVTAPNERLTLAKECLNTYPLHPIASEIYAEELAKTLGNNVAARYREAIQRFANTSCLKKDTHAHN